MQSPDVRVFQTDKAAVLLTPYNAPEEKADVAKILTGIEAVSYIWREDEARRYFLAGGGTEAEFSKFWLWAMNYTVDGSARSNLTCSSPERAGRVQKSAATRPAVGGPHRQLIPSWCKSGIDRRDTCQDVHQTFQAAVSLSKSQRGDQLTSRRPEFFGEAPKTPGAEQFSRRGRCGEPLAASADMDI
jgi:hypothetical protein